MNAKHELLCLTLVCAVVACLLGCENTESGANANAKTSDKEKSALTDATIDEGPRPITDAQDNVPQPDPTFKGKIGKTFHDAQADPKLFLPRSAPQGAPNILLVLIDDAGFGASSTFGGPCNTPTLDKLAKNGLRYNRFHTTALCSPTRAALLTGHNHHSASTGIILECATGFPGYTGIIPQNTASIGQILQDNGYSTAWIGKNHNVIGMQQTIVGPHKRWPNALGFDYFYGFLGGEMDQWYPTIYENQNPVQAWGTPEEGYNLGIDQTDKAIAWMHYQNSIAPDRPFFLYYAPGATHAPHQPPKEYAEKYKGKFAHGWDKQREITLDRQKQLGFVPQTTKLTPRPDGLKAWDEWDADAHKLFEREMEVYAGYYEFIDHQIGRIIDAIEETGELDNTLIIFIAGDNGASAEGTMTGTPNDVAPLNGIEFPIKDVMKFYDKWGQPGSAVHYAVGWAWAMDSPFQWTKQVASHFGGTRNPMVVSWPKRIKDKGGLRDQFHHVNDIAPTILDVIGLEQPEYVNGVKQKPMEGVSFAYTFADDGAKAEERKKTQYFEILGNRGVYHDGWMASVFHKAPWNTAGTVPFENDKWELYDITKDFSQADDLAAKNPKKLKEMQAIFDQEAKKFNVYPLDDRAAARFANPNGINRPNFMTGRTHFEFYPGASRLAEGSAPSVKSVSHSITADVVIPPKGAEGVLLAMGGADGGYVLYVKDKKLVYGFNWYTVDQYKVASTTDIPTGKVQLKMDFKYDGGGPGKGGTATLFINGKKAGEGRVEKTIPGKFGFDAMDVGMDLSSPVSPDYKPPFKFTGTIKKVTIDIKK
jgi:arylsulfatase